VDSELSHDGPDELLVHDHVVLAPERCGDPKHPVGAAGTLVDVGDAVGQKEPADLTIRGHVVLEPVVDGARDADDLARGAL